MSGWSYVPGPHPAILRENTLIAISGDGAEARARALLTTTTGSTALEDVLDVLIADGLASAPDFFVGRLVDGSLTAFVRGAAVVTVEDDRWHRFYVNGQHARTWQELALDGVARIAVGFATPTRVDLLSVPDDEQEAPQGPLGVSEVVFRSPQPLSSLFTVMGPPVAAPRTAEFGDAFPDDLFAPVDPELDGETRVTSLDAPRPGEDEPAADAPVAPVAPPPLPPAPPVAVAPALVATAPPVAPGSANTRPQATVILPDGRRVPITGTMIIGRGPRSERTTAGRLPTLVPLDGAPGDVSRNHVRVSIATQGVIVEDLGSANGTTVISETGGARRLQSGETALLDTGAVLDLGGVRLRVEDLT